MALKPTKQELKTVATKQRVLETAQLLFEQNGYDNVTIRDIAEASQTSIGSIYYHFGDKENIAIYPTRKLDSIYQETYQAILDDPRWQAASARERLVEFFVRMQVACLRSGELVLRLFYLHGLREAEQGVLRIKPERPLYHIILALVRACREDGSLVSALSDDEVFFEIITLSRGLLINWLIDQGQFEMEAQARKSIEYLLSGISA